MASYIYECGCCNEPAEAKHPSAKWCGRCRILKGYQAMHRSPNKCRRCSQRFWRETQGHIMCPDCDALAQLHGDRPLYPADVAMAAPCVICNREEQQTPFPSGIGICRGCLASPNMHEKVAAAIDKAYKDTVARAPKNHERHDGDPVAMRQLLNQRPAQPETLLTAYKARLASEPPRTFKEAA